MPLYQEWLPDQHSLAAIWHIEEDEAFFQTRTGIISGIKHPKKRIEHLTGRYLLQHLKADFPLHHIALDAHNKPRLPEDRYFFSISHSYPYVAAVISDEEECGIDIQVWKDRIEDIAYMFLSEAEQALCSISPSSRERDQREARMLTLAWAAKEAAYKWYGRRGAEFIRDLPVLSLETGSESGRHVSRLINYPPSALEAFHIEMACFGVPIALKGLLYRDFALSYIIRHRPDIYK